MNDPDFEVVLGNDLIEGPTPWFTTVLEAGTYSAKAIEGSSAGYEAYNNTGGTVKDCTSDNRCKAGWQTTFRIWSPALKGVSDIKGIVAQSEKWSATSHARYAARPVTFELEQTALVTFFIMDSYHDNIGGLTIGVRREPDPKT